MTKKNLASLIKEAIQNQTTKVETIVSNLQGVSLAGEQPTVTTFGVIGTWRINHLPVTDVQYSPSEIVGKIASIEQRESPVIQSIDGILEYPSLGGNSLASTIVDVPQPVGINIQVEAGNRQIAIYADEVLVRRGYGQLSAVVNVPAGKTPLNIVTVGSAVEKILIKLPIDIPASIQAFIPNAPNWVDSGYINTNYVDPITGSTGMTISWFNQDNVGGWNVYRVESQPYGIISGAYSSANRYFFSIINSGTVPYVSSVVKIANKLVGIIDTASSDNANSLFLAVIPFTSAYDATVFSGSVSVLSYRTIGTIVKNSSQSVVTFVDLNVKKGQSYAYAVDAYSQYDSSLRSTKSSTISAVAGDIFPPGPITLLSVIPDDNKRLAVSYITPSDLDYYATKAIYYYQGSGTGPIVNVNYVTDVGLPNTQDSMIIAGITSGTFYFLTTDIVGNTQYIFSGVPFYWTGSGAAGAGGGITNTAPTISIAQLSAEEMTLNPRMFAQFKLSATDAETPGAVTIQYRINSGTGDPWITAPTNPFTATIGVLNRDGWVSARAFDGTIFSSELLGTADFDTTPEISSTYSRYIVASGIMFVTGTVDDDTKSIKWYIDNGAEAEDPVISSSLLIDNLTTNKTFNLSFSISDGQRKIFKIDPYPLLGGLGNVGNSYREEVIRLPKTSSSIKDRSLGGTVTKTDVQVTLTSSPTLPMGVTFDRVKPVVNGFVVSGTANSIMDTTKNFTTNQYATYWDVEIVAGKGLGQRRNIVSGNATILSVSPAFATIPDTTSGYYVAETYRHYSDSGKVTSATNKSITDSTKAWIPNEFIGKELNIYSGTGAGQLAVIASGTATTVYLTTFLNPVPNTTSGYIINGPLSVDRNATEDLIIDYYSYVPTNGLTEEARSLSIDDDTTALIKSGTLIEITPNVVTVSIYSPDDDTKYWSLWARKNNWPTINSGSSTASLDNDYLRFLAADINVTSLTFAANNGWWYGIILPYDSYANPGNRTIFSGQVVGTPSPTIAILSLQIDSLSWFVGDVDIAVHKPWWTHNSLAEKPGGNGTATVKVWKKAPKDADYSELTSGVTRYTWQDSEDNDYKVNTDDTLNTLLGRGSWINPIGFKPSRGLWSYRVDLYDNGVFVNSYFTSIVKG